MATSRTRSTRTSLINGDPVKTPSRSVSRSRDSPSSAQSNDDSTKKQNKLTQAEIKTRLFKINLLGFTLANIFLVGVCYLGHTGITRFYPKHMNGDMLKGFSSRADYALRYQILQIFWLVANSLFVLYGKFYAYRLSIQQRSSSSQEFQIQQKICNFQNILSHSFEQTIISCFGQLIFVSFADKLTILKLIPLINIIQFFSRVAYFVGSPTYPSFGATLSFSSNTALVLYGLYRWGAFVRLY